MTKDIAGTGLGLQEPAQLAGIEEALLLKLIIYPIPHKSPRTVYFWFSVCHFQNTSSLVSCTSAFAAWAALR